MGADYKRLPFSRRKERKGNEDSLHALSCDARVFLENERGLSRCGENTCPGQLSYAIYQLPRCCQKVEEIPTWQGCLGDRDDDIRKQIVVSTEYSELPAYSCQVLSIMFFLEALEANRDQTWLSCQGWIGMPRIWFEPFRNLHDSEEQWWAVVAA